MAGRRCRLHLVEVLLSCFDFAVTVNCQTQQGWKNPTFGWIMTQLTIRPLFALTLVAGLALAQQKQEFVDVQVTSHVLRPEQVEATDERMKKLKVPEGFRISKFAENLGNPRMIAVADDGTVYVTRRKSGDCLMLRDSDGDGRADQQKVVAQKPDLHSVAVDGNRVFLADIQNVYVADRKPDGTLGELKQIISGLPDGGQHPNRTLAVGSDKMLYITVGSSCNACTETNPEHATMLRATPDGSKREIFASGLRNTLGFAWHPQTRELWGMDHGMDWLGDQEQKEELNLIVQGAKYGWPYVYADSKLNPQDDPPKGTKEEWAKASREPHLLYTAHAAPMQMVFYTGSQFPEEYRNDAFVAMRGSWNRRPPSGYEVVRIRFENGKPTGFEPFLTGFVQQEGEKWVHFGRLAGLAITPDGSLLAGDDANGVIYRIGQEESAIRSRKAPE
jgi:glucose/arabinose dehydrogenase